MASHGALQMMDIRITMEVGKVGKIFLCVVSRTAVRALYRTILSIRAEWKKYPVLSEKTFRLSRGIVFLFWHTFCLTLTGPGVSQRLWLSRAEVYRRVSNERTISFAEHK
jgi:hypothetical protein